MLNKNAEVLLRNTPIPDPSLLQDKLVSGTNIKTINGTSLLGSGDISLGGVGSVNGQTGDVVLTAPDVEAVPVDNRQFIDLAGAGADFILGWSHATYTKGLNYNSNYQAATDHQVIPVAVSYLDNGAVYRVYNDTLYTIVLTATDNMGTPSGTINGVASIDLPSFSFVELTGVGGNAIVVHSDQTYLIYNLVPEAPIDGTDYVRKDGAWVASTGGGSTTITQYEIDFGTTPRSDLEFTISDASVLVGSKIIATVGYEATTDNTADEAVACGLQVVVGQVAAGSFKLLGFSNTSLLKGKYKINYIIGA